MTGKKFGAKVGISKQRRRIIQLHARGLSDEQIAKQMGLKVATVQYYWKYIYRALELQGQPKPRTLVLGKAVEKGVLPPSALAKAS